MLTDHGGERWRRSSMTSDDAARYPTRSPLSAYAFDIDLATTRFGMDRTKGSSDAPSPAKSTYVSSTQIRVLVGAARRTDTRSWLATWVPVGLFGLTRTAMSKPFSSARPS